MSELAYVGAAVTVTLLASLVIWLRSRRPQSVEAGINDFSRGLAALQQTPVARSRRSG